jgi:hypothetical protein
MSDILPHIANCDPTAESVIRSTQYVFKVQLGQYSSATLALRHSMNEGFKSISDQFIEATTQVPACGLMKLPTASTTTEYSYDKHSATTKTTLLPIRDNVPYTPRTGALWGVVCEQLTGVLEAICELERRQTKVITDSINESIPAPFAHRLSQADHTLGAVDVT